MHRRRVSSIGSMKKAKNLTLTDRLLKGGIVVLFFSFLASPLGYAIRMLLSRVLSQEDFGLLFAVVSFFTFLTMFNDLGYGQSIAFFIPQYYSKKKYQVCWLLYKYDQYIESLTSLVIIILLFFTRDFWINSFFKHQHAESLIFAFFFYLLANGITSSAKKAFLGFQQEVYYASIEFVRLLVTFAFVLYFFLSGTTEVLFYSSAFIGGYVFVALLYTFFFYEKYSKFKTKIIFKNSLVKKTIQYAIPTFFATSLFILISSIDTLFLTYFQTVKVVAVYNIIFPLFSILFVIFDPISTMLLPLVSELQSDKEDSSLKIIIEQILVFFPFLSVAFSLFLFMFPETIISFMFGEKWVKDASFFLQFMAIGYIPIGINRYLSSVINGLGRVKEKLTISILLLVLSVILGAIGAYYFAILGIIVANCIVFSLSFFLQLWVIKKDVPVCIPYKKYILMALFLLCGIILRSNTGALRLDLFQVILIGGLYGLFLSVVVIKFHFIDRNFVMYIRNKILRR